MVEQACGPTWAAFDDLLTTGLTSFQGNDNWPWHTTAQGNIYNENIAFQYD